MDVMGTYGSERTVSTEVYIPPSQNTCNRAASEPSGRPEVDGRLAAKSVGNPQHDTFRSKRSRSHSENAQQSTMQKKLRTSQLAAADVRAAVGLTVTAAEAMVVAALLGEDKTMLESVVAPSVVLEAAISLRRARQECGLDEYTLDANPPPSGLIDAQELSTCGDNLIHHSCAPEEEDGLLETLDDCEILEALADVGVLGAPEPGEMATGDGASKHEARGNDHMTMGFNSFPHEAALCSQHAPETPHHVPNVSVQPLSIVSKDKDISLLQQEVHERITEGPEIGVVHREVENHSKEGQGCVSSSVGPELPPLQIPNVKDSVLSAVNTSLIMTEVVDANKLAVREDNSCVAADNSTAKRQLPQVYEGSKYEKIHKPCTFPTAGEYATENAEVTTTERRSGNANLFLSEKEVPERDTRLGVPELQCGMWDKKEDSTQQESNIQILHSEGNLHSTELVTPMCIMYDRDKGASCPTSKLYSTFSSRWFGGWTGNGNITSENQAAADSRRVLIQAELETRYSLEPWDIGTEDAVPEQRAALNHHRAHQSEHPLLDVQPVADSKHLIHPSELVGGGIVDKADNNRELSPQAFGSTDFEFHVDPLSSFVPCSIAEPAVSHVVPLAANVGWLDLHVAVEKRSDVLGEIEPGVCDSVRRIHVDSLRPYSTSVNPCERAATPPNSLHFLLHAAEVAGAKQRGAAASGEIDPVPILGKQMLPSKSRNLLDEEGTCRPVSLGAVEGAAGTAAMKSCAGCQAHATPSKDKDVGLEQNHLIGGYSCESSSQGGFPPLHIWKKRRLRACRVVESDIQSGEGQAPFSNSAALNKGVSRFPGDPGADEPAQVATEEVQEHHPWESRENVDVEDEEALPHKSQSIIRHGLKISIRPSKSRTHDKKLSKVVGQKIVTVTRKQKVAKRNSTSNRGEKQGLLFDGLQFLLTGFSSDKKDNLARIIEEHGGVVLTDIPRPPHLRSIRRRKGEADERPPIVIAPQQVRTPKFLFACAVGFPALKPTWISESICREELLPETSYWHKPKKSARKLVAGQKGARDVSPSGNKLQEDSIFHNLKIYLHGKPSFCTQMKALIEHGGGKVVSNIKALDPKKNATRSFICLVAAEEPCKVPDSLRHLITCLELPLMGSS
ncbi:hypothetical protein CY35_03G049100 [Sphagnum magellanicum]|nr:hypothetical protein CY35_03G049100 [Sphagnum magellanicum]